MERKKKMLIDKKAINLLFKNGKTNKSFPIIMYSISSNENKVLFTVSKKHFLRAVDRNKIKRQLKSIYFNNTNQFKDKIKQQNIAFVYISNTKLTYLQLNQKIIKLLSTINSNEEEH
jgi:ribonuclease P protein component